MGRARIMLILTIVIATLLSILYLIYQSKELEKYTAVPIDSSTAFIIYSSQGADLKDNTSTVSLLESFKKSFQSMGYETVSLGNNKNPEAIRKEISNSITGSRKYIILDINVSQNLGTKGTLLIKVSSKNKDKYKENLKSATAVRDSLKSSKVKVNIYTDTKYSLNQDMGSTALNLEISKQNTLKEARELIMNAAYALTK